MENNKTIIKNDSIKTLYIALMDELVRMNINSRQLVLFDSIHGSKYMEDNVKLLVIGRANNGWDNYYNPFNETDMSTEKIAAYRKDRFKHMESRKDLLSVVNGWKNKTGKGYNFYRSQFWRVTKRIAKSITNVNSDEALNSVCYSNLYKVAFEGRNPNEKIKRITRPNNIEILRLEIDLYKPDRILFLTGESWAEPFLFKLGITKTAEANSQIRFQGHYKGIKVIVVDHPQGKNENRMVGAILDAWKLTLGHISNTSSNGD